MDERKEIKIAKDNNKTKVPLPEAEKRNQYRVRCFWQNWKHPSKSKGTTSSNCILRIEQRKKDVEEIELYQK